MPAAASLLSLRAWFRAPVRRALARQLYFSGLESLALVVLIGIAVGAIIVSQLHFGIGQSGGETLRLMATLLLSELSPLLTALILIARSSSAMASELAAMRVNNETWMLQQFGVHPAHYLMLPRVTAMLLASFLLAIYLSLSSLLVGALLVSGANAVGELARLGDVLMLSTVLEGLAKTALFGLVIAFVACRTGLRAGGAMTEIPRAASRAVVSSLLSVFIIDALWGLLL